MSHVEESLSNVGDSSTSCVVIDLLKPPNSRIIFGVSTVTTFADFYSSVGKRFHYVSGTFNLVLVKRSVLEEIGPA
uniref:Uncharacterized protein n=1 Tax=Ciona savignyi TaxID=51511 RepID=H2YJ74_CIOSA